MPEGLRSRISKSLAPERSSVTEKFTVTGPPEVVIPLGAKLKEVRLGGLVSLVVVTTRFCAAGNWLAAAAVSRNRVLPAPSTTLIKETFQVPASLSCGKLMTSELV